MPLILADSVKVKRIAAEATRKSLPVASPARTRLTTKNQRISKKVGQLPLIEPHCFFRNCPTCKVEGWGAFWSLCTSQPATSKSLRSVGGEIRLLNRPTTFISCSGRPYRQSQSATRANFCRFVSRVSSSAVGAAKILKPDWGVRRVMQALALALSRLRASPLNFSSASGLLPSFSILEPTSQAESRNSTISN